MTDLPPSGGYLIVSGLVALVVVVVVVLRSVHGSESRHRADTIRAFADLVRAIPLPLTASLITSEDEAPDFDPSKLKRSCKRDVISGVVRVVVRNAAGHCPWCEFCRGERLCCRW